MTRCSHCAGFEQIGFRFEARSAPRLPFPHLPLVLLLLRRRRPLPLLLILKVRSRFKAFERLPRRTCRPRLMRSGALPNAPEHHFTPRYVTVGCLWRGLPGQNTMKSGGRGKTPKRNNPRGRGRGRVAEPEVARSTGSVKTTGAQPPLRIVPSSARYAPRPPTITGQSTNWITSWRPFAPGSLSTPSSLLRLYPRVTIFV